VDTDKKIRHARLAEDMEKEMLKVQVQANLAQETALEICYSPIIQSGEQCSLKFSAESTDKLLHYGSIVSMIGIRYLSYCSNVARTMLVMPTPLVEELYEILLTTEQAIIDTLKPGKLISNAYESGLQHFKSKKPDYLQYLLKTSFGFVTGIEFRESLLLISDKCKQPVEKNMTFVVAVGLQNFPNKEAKEEANKTTSIFISDTILVCEEGNNEVLTVNAKSRLRANAIRFRTQENGEDNTKVMRTRSCRGNIKLY